MRLELYEGNAVEAAGVSGDGHWIVGSVHNGSAWQAAIWSSADGSVLIPPDSTGATYTCVSRDGSTIGGAYFGAATLWNSGVRQSLLITGIVAGVSDSGAFAVGEGYGPHASAEAFLWSSQSGVVWLGSGPNEPSSRASDVSENGRVVVGQRKNGSGTTTGFIWTAELGMVDLQEEDQSSNERLVVATELCERRGIVFGTSPRADHSSDDGVAFWDIQARHVLKFGPLDKAETFSIVRAVTASGMIGVGWSEAVNEDRALLWDALLGTRSLQEVASEQFHIDLSHWILETAIGISDDGRIMIGRGMYYGAGGQGYILVRPTPRPAPASPP